VSTQEILFAVASQSLVLEVDRPLSSVTSVSVWPMGTDDTATAESATTGSAAVDTATEATTAAAGYGQTDRTKLTMASTTGFVVGRRGYISVNGISETFEIERIHTNTAIYTRHPLVNAYASGATVDMTTRATISVSDTWAAAVANLSPTADPNPSYRVRWVVVHADDSSTAVYLRNFDLVRYPSAPPVSPLDVDAAHPGWIDSLSKDDKPSQGRRLIVEATRFVRLDLYHRGLADQALRTAETFAALVIDRAVLAKIEDAALRGADVAAALDVATKRYDRRLAGLVDSPRLAVDLTGGGAATTKAGRAERVLRR
jgi:hypothetical protein